MNKIKFYYLILFLIFISKNNLLAQNDYISKEGVDSVGVKLIDGTAFENAQFIKLKNKNNIIKYTPTDLIGYGLNDKKNYKSFDVDIGGTVKRYFLERLVEGKINLFYLKTDYKIPKYYLTENNSNVLIAIPEGKEDYLKILNQYISDCLPATRNIKHIQLRRNILTRFFRDYNNCSKSYLPRVRYGFNAGVAANKISPSEPQGKFAIPHFKSDLGVSAGVFINVPIGISNFSWHSEISFKRSNKAIAFEDQNNTHDLIINYSALNLPVLIRYSFLKSNITPFLQIGPIYSRILKKSTILSEYKVEGDNIFIEFNDVPALSSNQGGVSFGGGLIFKYGSNYSLFFEGRHNKLYNINRQTENFNVNEASFTIGVIF